jgi:hypothetical protein
VIVEAVAFLTAYGLGFGSLINVLHNYIDDDGRIVSSQHRTLSIVGLVYLFNFFGSVSRRILSRSISPSPRGAATGSRAATAAAAAANAAAAAEDKSGVILTRYHGPCRTAGQFGRT